MGMFLKLKLIEAAKLQSLYQFAILISKNYFENPYHCFHHAVDVTYIVYYLMEDMSLGDQIDLQPSEKAILLIAALGHDVLHPGTNNLYQVIATHIDKRKNPCSRKVRK
jgi:hypothetical protein